MHIGRHIVQELVLQFGDPHVERWDVPMSREEFDKLVTHRERRRSHDVTLVILNGDDVAVIRKPGYPDGAFRIPSGGIHPEESFLDGAAREALEETGLTVHIEDYLLQIHANFTHESEEVKWTTHVMLASATGEVAPRDLEEIESARWVSWSTLMETMNPILAARKNTFLGYRARIHQRLAELDVLREVIGS